MSDLSVVIIYGLSIFFAAQFARALPWPARWLSVKPLSCNACMTGWSTIAHAGFVWWRAESVPDLLPLFAAAGLSYLAMRWCDVNAGAAWAPPQ